MARCRWASSPNSRSCVSNSRRLNRVSRNGQSSTMPAPSITRSSSTSLRDWGVGGVVGRAVAVGSLAAGSVGFSAFCKAASSASTGAAFLAASPCNATSSSSACNAASSRDRCWGLAAASSRCAATESAPGAPASCCSRARSSDGGRARALSRAASSAWGGLGPRPSPGGQRPVLA